MNIRCARLEDAEILSDLVGQLKHPIDVKTMQMNLSSYLNDPDREVLIMEIDKKVVGFLALDIFLTFHHAKKQMRIVSLVIDESHRGKGIGRMLIEEAEKIAKENGCWMIELTSASWREKEGTHTFYESLGYVKNGPQAYFRKNYF